MTVASRVSPLPPDVKPAAAGSALANLYADTLAVIAMLIIALLGGVLLIGHRHTTTPFHPAVTLAEMRGYVDAGDTLILDARNQSDYKAGHIPTALNLPIAEWTTRSKELSATLKEHRDRLVIVYCGDKWCGQSEDLQLALIDDGHVRVGRFGEGFGAWLGAGLPVTCSP